MISTLPAQPPASSVIRESSIPALRRLSVDENETTVVLQGMVSSYYLKQLAQEMIKPALCGRQLVNSVAVIVD
jgi:hypothetical protein